MKTVKSKTNWALALAVAGVLASGFAAAEKGGGKGKDERADKGHGDKVHGNSQRDKGRGNKTARHNGGDKSSKVGGKRDHFGDHHRVALNDYYGQQFRSGRCPPGLAKKNNGCLPPGQAKKWHTGQHLPRNVTYYSVPQSLVTQFGPPPPGYRYVRVGSDVLLMETATRMIVDALQGLRG